MFGDGPEKSVRHFPDKLPIGMQPHADTHVFVYLVTRPSPMDFRLFLLRHTALLRVIFRWTSGCSSRANSGRRDLHVGVARVICQRDGVPLTQDMVGDHVRRAARRAQIVTSGVHRLRHTFCSHLAMRGAPARAIQELAGHQDLTTTQRYMHLSPAAIEGAIRLLDQRGGGGNRGDMVETGVANIGNSNL